MRDLHSSGERQEEEEEQQPEERLAVRMDAASHCKTVSGEEAHTEAEEVHEAAWRAGKKGGLWAGPCAVAVAALAVEPWEPLWEAPWKVAVVL